MDTRAIPTDMDTIWLCKSCGTKNNSLVADCAACGGSRNRGRGLATLRTNLRVNLEKGWACQSTDNAAIRNNHYIQDELEEESEPEVKEYKRSAGMSIFLCISRIVLWMGGLSLLALACFLIWLVYSAWTNAAGM